MSEKRLRSVIMNRDMRIDVVLSGSMVSCAPTNKHECRLDDSPVCMQWDVRAELAKVSAV